MKRIILSLALSLFMLPSLVLGQTSTSMGMQAGKIWAANDFIYVNMLSRGVMVVDNLDPQNPERVGFIEIPGNVDMAVRDTLLYANSFQDLVVINIKDLKNIQEVARIENVFNHQRSGFGQMTAVNWRTGNELTDFIGNTLNILSGGGISNTNSGTNNISGGTLGNLGINGINNNTMVTMNNPTNGGGSGTTGGSGKGGSMACFTMVDNYLYAIDAMDIHVFDINSPAKPEKTGFNVRVNNDIETIFAHGNELYIGAQSGMHIYDISNRTNPVRLGGYRHTTSCDPVVVEGNFAYVTLRGGTDCRGDVNQLDVIDISDKTRPRKVRSFNMRNPHGLGIDNGILFVCDGSAGLKVFDASDPRNVGKNEIARFPNITTYDVIPLEGKKILLMIGKDNKLYQYDYLDPANVTLMSELDLRQAN